MDATQRVQEIGEQGLLKKLQSFCPADLVGDDAALLSIAEQHSLVVTTDTLVDGVHFSDRTTTAADAGWRAVAANLSDLAAMGAMPLGITVGLALPGELSVAWVEQLYQGMAACLQPFNTPIVGGDVCRSPVATISITAFGQVRPAYAIRRSTAQPGDAIVVTGVHGASRAGLELLLHPESGQTLCEDDRTALIQAHQRPKPRLDAIPLLWQAHAAHPSPDKSWRVAGMDSSDGLADAVLQICRESDVGAVLERDRLPVPGALRNWLSEAKAIEWTLYGGEDFELVLCLPPAIAQEFVSRLPGGAIVGTITAASEVVLQDRTATYADEVLTMSQGFQHF